MGLFGKWGKAKRRRSVRPPPDCVVWSIGDVHGRLDLLEPLVGAISADLERSPARRKVVVFLGDYVDRGPESRGVIEFLMNLPHQAPFEFHFLRGNHEDRMEAFLTNPSVGPSWCDYGGREALLSYGITAPTQRDDTAGWEAASQALGEAMGPDQRAFLSALEMYVGIGAYFFVHAGAKPGVPLEQQSPHDLMWVRQTFLEDPRPFDRLVVHGHTPAEDVYADDRRIGLDTGAYATGVLSALRLEDDDQVFLQTGKTGVGVELFSRRL